MVQQPTLLTCTLWLTISLISINESVIATCRWGAIVRSQMLTQADERLLCATLVITDPKRVAVSVPAEPVSEHHIHLFIISVDSELETAQSYSSQPHPEHLLAAAPESRPSDSSTPGCNRSGRNVRRGVTEKRICTVAAAIRRGGGRGIRTESFNSSPTA